MIDLEEIIHLMRDRSSGHQIVRCSKLRAMFAMRACRKSVMIGMPLNSQHMMTVSVIFLKKNLLLRSNLFLTL